MPRATVSNEPERFDLKTAPPDGYVVLKRMSWGEWLTRRDMGMKMAMEAGGSRKDRTSKIDIDVVQASVSRYEFQKCIVDHNLTDDQDRPLKLGNQKDFDQLDPRIANEIEQLIKDLHEFESEDEEEALFPGAESNDSPEPPFTGGESSPSGVLDRDYSTG